MGGKGGKKRKGRGLAVPRFGVGGLRTPSPTPSALGSVTGGGLTGVVSWDDAAKVPRLREAASVADKAVAELVARVTGMSCDPLVGYLAGLFALPIPVVTLLDRGKKKARWLGSRVESGFLELDSALWYIYEWCQENMSERGEREVACAAEHDEVLLEVGALRAKVAGLGVELAVVPKEAAAANSDSDYCQLGAQV